MKNKLIKCLSVAISLVSIATIFVSCSKKEANPLLVINGKYIATYKNYNIAKVYPEYATLPLIYVLTVLEFKIEWVNDKIANISREDKTFILNLKELTFIDNEDEDEFNMLLPPPGSNNNYSKVLKKEILLDDDTIGSIFHEMGMDVDINIDREQYSDGRPISVFISETK